MPHPSPDQPALPRPGAPASAASTPPRPTLRRRLLTHVAGWLLLCTSVALLLNLLTPAPPLHNLVFSLCIGGCIQALIEVGRHALSRWLRALGRTDPGLADGWPGWPLMAPYLVFAALAGHTLGALAAGRLLGYAHVATLLDSRGRALTAVFLLTIGVTALATYHFRVRSQLAKAAAQAEAAHRLAGETRLRLLQSQLEPHMLFNTLANLRALITLDPPRAQAMLDRLVAYLRATLGASRAGSHTLAEEFDRLADYLALMGLRMGPRLQVRLDLPAALRPLPVPALLLQPLVENAIRHGLEPRVAGGRLEVAAARAGAQLVLTVRDTGVGLPPAWDAAPDDGATDGAPDSSRYGTRHVAERLATLYGPAAGFVLRPADDADGGTLARIVLPWPADDRPHPAP